jgi:hypothetical protein
MACTKRRPAPPPSDPGVARGARLESAPCDGVLDSYFLPSQLPMLLPMLLPMFPMYFPAPRRRGSTWVPTAPVKAPPAAVTCPESVLIWFSSQL